MWLVFGRKSKAKRVADGKTELRKCPHCGKTGTFFEAEVRSKYTAFVAIELFDTSRTAYICSVCEEVSDLDDTLDPELPSKLGSATQPSKHESTLEQLKRFEQQQDREKAAKETAVDHQLAELRKRLGK